MTLEKVRCPIIGGDIFISYDDNSFFNNPEKTKVQCPEYSEKNNTCFKAEGGCIYKQPFK